MKVVNLECFDKHDSLDPIHGDKWKNMIYMRSLYHRLFDYDENGNLTSYILSSYTYDVESKLLKMRVKKGLKFESGQDLKTLDIVHSLLRLIYFVPSFPVTKDILGIHDWIKLNHKFDKLPNGLKFDDENIQIEFSSKVDHPESRLSFELFSIIPSSSINPVNLQLVTDHPSESGFYKLEGTCLKLRLDNIQASKFPKEICYKYPTHKRESFQDISSNELVINRGDLLKKSTLETLPQDYILHSLPCAFMLMVLLNPNIPPFNEANFRLNFAKYVYLHIKSNSKYLVNPSMSFFTRGMPGFLEDDEFTEVVNHDLSKPYRKEKLKFFVPRQLENSDMINALESALTYFGFENVIKVELSTTTELTKKFLGEESFYLLASTGLSHEDPFNDLQMYFTKNLHLPLTFLSEDHNLRELLDDKLANASSDFAKENIMREINKYLHLDAKLFTLAHLGYHFITHKNNYNSNYDNLRDAAGPYWHLFNGE